MKVGDRVEIIGGHFGSYFPGANRWTDKIGKTGTIIKRWDECREGWRNFYDWSVKIDEDDPWTFQFSECELKLLNPQKMLFEIK